MSDDIIEMLTQSMIAPRPNTYTYTKAIAETLLVDLCSASNVPCAIVRPSIVGASWQQPVAVSCHFCCLHRLVCLSVMGKKPVVDVSIIEFSFIVQ